MKTFCACNRLISTLTINSHQEKCSCYLNHKKLLNQFDFLKNLIEVEEYSIDEILKRSNELLNIKTISRNWFEKWLLKNDIKRRTIKESNSTKRRHQKVINTALKNYGVTNVSKSNIIKQRKEDTCLKLYGVKNPYQSEEKKDKIKQTMLNRYGSESFNGSKFYKPHSGIISNPHNLVSNWLLCNNISHQNEVGGKFFGWNDKLDRNYSPRVDILLNDHQIVIEIFGDYWHANPKFYKMNDIIKLYHGNELAKNIWDHDRNRIDHIKSFKFNVIILWEHDINNFSFSNTVLESIK